MLKKYNRKETPIKPSRFLSYFGGPNGLYGIKKPQTFLGIIKPLLPVMLNYVFHLFRDPILGVILFVKESLAFNVMSYPAYSGR